MADHAIGKVQTLSGSVEAVRADGTTVELHKGDNVFQGDVVKTGQGAAVGMVLEDGTTFSLGEKGKMALDQMVYDPGTKSGEAHLTLQSGSFALVSGQISKTAPDALSIKTPTMTVGIRGTGLTGNSNTIAMMQEKGGRAGEVFIQTSSGAALTLNQAGQGATLGAGGSLTQVTFSPTQVMQIGGNASFSLPNAGNLLSNTYTSAASQVQQQQQQQQQTPPPPPPVVPPGASSLAPVEKTAQEKGVEALKAVRKDADKIAVDLGLKKATVEADLDKIGLKVDRGLGDDLKKLGEDIKKIEDKVHADIAQIQAGKPPPEIVLRTEQILRPVLANNTESADALAAISAPLGSPAHEYKFTAQNGQPIIITVDANGGLLTKAQAAAAAATSAKATATALVNQMVSAALTGDYTGYASLNAKLTALSAQVDAAEAIADAKALEAQGYSDTAQALAQKYPNVGLAALDTLTAYNTAHAAAISADSADSTAHAIVANSTDVSATALAAWTGGAASTALTAATAKVTSAQTLVDADQIATGAAVSAIQTLRAGETTVIGTYQTALAKQFAYDDATASALALKVNAQNAVDAWGTAYRADLALATSKLSAAAASGSRASLVSDAQTAVTNAVTLATDGHDEAARVYYNATHGTPIATLAAFRASGGYAAAITDANTNDDATASWNTSLQVAQVANTALSGLVSTDDTAVSAAATIVGQTSAAAVSLQAYYTTLYNEYADTYTSIHSQDVAQQALTDAATTAFNNYEQQITNAQTLAAAKLATSLTDMTALGEAKAQAASAEWYYDVAHTAAVTEATSDLATAAAAAASAAATAASAADSAKAAADAAYADYNSNHNYSFVNPSLTGAALEDPSNKTAAYTNHYNQALAAYNAAHTADLLAQSKLADAQAAITEAHTWNVYSTSMDAGLAAAQKSADAAHQAYLSAQSALNLVVLTDPAPQSAVDAANVQATAVALASAKQQAASANAQAASADQTATTAFAQADNANTLYGANATTHNHYVASQSAKSDADALAAKAAAYDALVQQISPSAGAGNSTHVVTSLGTITLDGVGTGLAHVTAIVNASNVAQTVNQGNYDQILSGIPQDVASAQYFAALVAEVAASAKTKATTAQTEANEASAAAVVVAAAAADAALAAITTDSTAAANAATAATTQLAAAKTALAAMSTASNSDAAVAAAAAAALAAKTTADTKLADALVQLAAAKAASDNATSLGDSVTSDSQDIAKTLSQVETYVAQLRQADETATRQSDQAQYVATAAAAKHDSLVSAAAAQAAAAAAAADAAAAAQASIDAKQSARSQAETQAHTTASGYATDAATQLGNTALLTYNSGTQTGLDITNKVYKIAGVAQTSVTVADAVTAEIQTYLDFWAGNLTKVDADAAVAKGYANAAQVDFDAAAAAGQGYQTAATDISSAATSLKAAKTASANAAAIANTADNLATAADSWRAGTLITDRQAASTALTTATTAWTDAKDANDDAASLAATAQLQTNDPAVAKAAANATLVSQQDSLNTALSKFLAAVGQTPASTSLADLATAANAYIGGGSALSGSSTEAAIHTAIATKWTASNDSDPVHVAWHDGYDSAYNAYDNAKTASDQADEAYRAATANADTLQVQADAAATAYTAAQSALATAAAIEAAAETTEILGEATAEKQASTLLADALSTINAALNDASTGATHEASVASTSATTVASEATDAATHFAASNSAALAADVTAAQAADVLAQAADTAAATAAAKALAALADAATAKAWAETVVPNIGSALTDAQTAWTQAKAQAQADYAKVAAYQLEVSHQADLAHAYRLSADKALSQVLAVQAQQDALDAVTLSAAQAAAATAATSAATAETNASTGSTNASKAALLIDGTSGNDGTGVADVRAAFNAASSAADSRLTDFRSTLSALVASGTGQTNAQAVFDYYKANGHSSDTRTLAEFAASTDFNSTNITAAQTHGDISASWASALTAISAARVSITTVNGNLANYTTQAGTDLGDAQAAALAAANAYGDAQDKKTDAVAQNLVAQGTSVLATAQTAAQAAAADAQAATADAATAQAQAAIASAKVSDVANLQSQIGTQVSAAATLVSTAVNKTVMLKAVFDASSAFTTATADRATALTDKTAITSATGTEATSLASLTALYTTWVTNQTAAASPDAQTRSQIEAAYKLAIQSDGLVQTAKTKAADLFDKANSTLDVEGQLAVVTAAKATAIAATTASDALKAAQDAISAANLVTQYRTLITAARTVVDAAMDTNPTSTGTIPNLLIAAQNAATTLTTATATKSHSDLAATYAATAATKEALAATSAATAKSEASLASAAALSAIGSGLTQSQIDAFVASAQSHATLAHNAALTASQAKLDAASALASAQTEQAAAVTAAGGSALSAVTQYTTAATASVTAATTSSANAASSYTAAHDADLKAAAAATGASSGADAARAAAIDSIEGSIQSEAAASEAARLDALAQKTAAVAANTDVQSRLALAVTAMQTWITGHPGVDTGNVVSGLITKALALEATAADKATAASNAYTAVFNADASLDQNVIDIAVLSALNPPAAADVDAAQGKQTASDTLATTAANQDAIAKAAANAVLAAQTNVSAIENAFLQFKSQVEQNIKATNAAAVQTAVNNAAVVAVNDTASVNESVGGTVNTVTVNVLANDKHFSGSALGVGGNITAETVVLTAVGTAAHGTVVINANNTITYTPDKYFYGTDTVTYTVTDTATLSVAQTDAATVFPTRVTTATGTVTFTVNHVNVAPTVINNTVVGLENTSGSTTTAFTASSFTNVFTDLNQGDSLVKIKITALPTEGALQLSGTNVTVGQEITLANLGNLTYKPVLYHNGNFTFSWQASDGLLYSNTATATVTVQPVATAPTITTVNATGVEYTTNATSIPLSISVSNADTTDSVSTITITGVPSGASLNHGTLSGSTYTLTQADLTGLTLTPAQYGTTAIHLTITATSTDHTVSKQASTTLDVTLTPAATAPTVTLLPMSVSEVGAGGQPFSVPLTVTDPDTSDTLGSIKISGLPSGATLSSGTTTLLATGGTYTLTSAQVTAGLSMQPPAYYNGTVNLNVVATSTDGTDSKTTTTTKSFTIAPVASMPSLTAAGTGGPESASGTTVPLTISTTDADTSDTVTVKISNLPAGATLNHGTLANGTYTLSQADLTGLTLHTPNYFNGAVALNVVALSTDGTASQTSPASTLNLTITPVATAPTIATGTISGTQSLSGGATTISLGSVVTDLDTSDSVAVHISGLPSGATLSAGTLSGGTYTMTKAEASSLSLTTAGTFNGSVNLAISATATDGTASQTSTGTLHVQVTPPTIGTSGNDTFYAGSGNDTLTGGGGSDTIIYHGPEAYYALSTNSGGTITVADASATDGTDSLIGFTTLQFTDGSLTVSGTAGAQTLTGGTGVDTIALGSGFKGVVLGAGADNVAMSATALAALNTLDGGAGSDTLTLTSVGTVISDSMFAHMSNVETLKLPAVSGETLSLGTVAQAAGISVVDASSASGTLTLAGSGAAGYSLSLIGSPGSDTYVMPASQTGTLTLQDSGGTNVLNVASIPQSGVFGVKQVGSDAQVILGSSAGGGTLVIKDQFAGTGAGIDHLVTGSSNPNTTIIGAVAGATTLTGSSGEDVFASNSAVTTMISGGGEDSFFIANADQVVVGDATSGGDVNFAFADSAVTATSAVANFGGHVTTLSNINHLVGSTFGDTLTGDLSGMVLEGGAGNNSLIGAASGVTAGYQHAGAGIIANLSGTSLSVGTNTVAAGTVLNGSGGTDTLSGIQSIRGSMFDDVIKGGDSGTYTLDGGLGNDTLIGGNADTQFRVSHSGNNTVTGGTGDNTLSYTDFTGGTVTDSAFAHVTNVEKLTLSSNGTATAASVVFGTNSDNADLSILDAQGFGAAVTLDAHSRSGAITLRGGSGNDTLTGGSGINSLFEQTSGATATITVSGSTTTIAGAAGTDVITGASQDIVFNDGTVSVRGGGATVIGGGGNDHLIVGASTGLVSLGTGTDSVQASSGNHVFAIPGYDLTSYDTIIGGTGSNTISLVGSSASVSDASFTHVSGVQRLLLDAATNGGTITLGTAAQASGLSVVDATLTGSTTNVTAVAGSMTSAVTFLAGSGHDSFTGGSGQDAAVVLGNEADADLMGYSGNLNLSFTGAFAGASLSLTSVESLYFADGKSLSVAYGGGLTTVTGGSGNDVIKAGWGIDVIDAGSGGNDTLIASGGAATFNLHSGLTSADTITGGIYGDRLVL
ncbi:hypothetical protein CU669_20070, partial [Paramagnetospirillum kuznetsovii]